jgi:hypothetical protein
MNMVHDDYIQTILRFMSLGLPLKLQLVTTPCTLVSGSRQHLLALVKDSSTTDTWLALLDDKLKTTINIPNIFLVMAEKAAFSVQGVNPNRPDNGSPSELTSTVHQIFVHLFSSSPPVASAKKW